MQVTIIPVVIGAFGTITKELLKGLEHLERRGQDYGIVRIGQNTEKGSGGLKRLAVTQTPVRNHQLTTVGKTLKRLATRLGL